MRTIFTAAVLMSAAAIAAPAQAGINQRQAHQQQRIYNGVRTGELTSREASRLERQQEHIDRVEARDRASGGGLSGRERAQIAHLQNHASRNIYRQKHDAQER